jgi:cyclopropane fatty-acyl-phospholipid synthase-like methyltransferase
MSIILKSSKNVVVELGMGDGRLLEKLARSNPNFTYIGIELDKQQYEDAKSRIDLKNVILLHGSFEDLVPTFPDNSVDRVISILPDPSFIDQIKQQKWQPFYRIVYSKLKKYGSFYLATEITDDLLLPISDEVYNKWVEWLIITFQSIGFELTYKKEDIPTGYSTRCIDWFRHDSQRIRIVTLNFIKK